MKPEDFLDLARDLNKGSSSLPVTESCIRTSISRAYYYIFLKIRDSLIAWGASFNRRDTHREVIECLYKDKASSVIAQNLDSLRQKRNEADYDIKRLGFEYGSDKASLAIGEAERLKQDYDSIDKTVLARNIKSRHS